MSFDRLHQRVFPACTAATATAKLPAPSLSSNSRIGSDLRSQPNTGGIVSGESLGAVFKSAGWRIEKHNIYVGEFEIPAKYGLISELMQTDLPEFLATHVYVFVINKNERSYNYATIAELHHPDYLSGEDLRRIYGEIIFDDSDRTSIDDFVDPELWKN